MARLLNPSLPYADRAEAAQHLADALQQYASRTDLLILGLARGGVPVAYHVAQRLNAPLEVMVVRKLGMPGHEELAMGAIATGGVHVENRDVLEHHEISPRRVQEVKERELAELERRERELRGDRAPPQLTARCVILIDDGLATGASMRSAVTAARAQGAAEVVVAVPVAPASTAHELRVLADEVICLATPSPFFAIGEFYRDFSQVSTEQARKLLELAWNAGLEPVRRTGAERKGKQVDPLRGVRGRRGRTHRNHH